ncbi:dihydrolipoamide acetyltransferase family protein [Chondromyces apiculatus]|uniref:Dihydrolipoamide acetyltransferase component of pyruvate dehydrogenase complex n=1 Tax=Chondromyces apiculatus DSM 436 TaxID=1192034 RepID=A0A017TG91_9BACT|nr:dihydrolipoamide acetyltransferase family protein [Chondromyces apiculatus]EYF08318.1 Dihydrolipoamide acyltransferase component of branched-chain alpha-keto acid dehydrogenase complex [Chondromyces apiculatus DSM 436]
MSKYEFKLPDIGEGVTEGEIVNWLVSPGDVVTEDQPMVEVMTDKATVTITSPKAGKIVETRGKAGEVVPVHDVLVVFDLSGGAAASAGEAAAHAPEAAAAPTSATAASAAAGGDAKKEPAATAVGDIKEDLPGMSLMVVADPTASAAPQAAPAERAYFNEKPLATPATRKLARDLGVDLRNVPPSGASGRVSSDDVRSFKAGGAQKGAAGGAGASGGAAVVPVAVAPGTAPAAVPPVVAAVGASAPAGSAPPGTPGPATAPAAASSEGHAPAASGAASAAPAAAHAQPARAPVKIPSSRAGGEGQDERIPLRGVRKRIFEQMGRSKQTAAHFTFVEECDVTALKELRARLRPAAEQSGVKLTFLPFIAKAVVAALKRHPTLNSAFDESTQEIVVRKAIHLGIASATKAGLIVPVVRDADRKSILDIARDIGRLGEDTKAGKVKAEDLGGSTFTITSLGQQGGLFATPILNFPEVGILGVHQMKQKPVVRDGQIVIGDVMLLSLSFDHRIIDGHIGAAFAYEVIGYLQDPDKLFLET